MFIGLQALGQKKDLSYYLPDIEYDTSIPTPEDYLGYQIGEWHISHDQLVGYMKEVARLSPRVTIEEYARSYEHRPLVLLTITSEKNQTQIDDIAAQHRQLCDPQNSKKVNINNLPSVAYQGYTVHGNESSGANATPLVLYYLAAGKSREVQDILDNVVVLLDPCFNPDGMDRFASWVNRHKNKNLTSDPNDREYREVWPGGRTNHYWFDLNRDWLLVQHPESQGRIRNFHKWKPNILTDHHEMGTNSTFFFQPGIPSRTNPITPAKNQELTGKIAEYHAAELDKIGSLYYSKESFDDFYYGKGSTYPDVNGSIGILFEQASSRGHLQESDNGLLDFPFTIRNQLTTSLSTQKAALGMRKELLAYQRDFYNNASKEASTDTRKSFVFSDAKDASKIADFIRLLLQHKIEVYELGKDVQESGVNFKKENSYSVPLNQPQYRLVKAMFETNTTFKDSLFYDVSAWTLPLAYNLEYAASSTFSKGKQVTDVPTVMGSVIGGESSYAYALEWDDYFAPNALFAIQNKGLITKVATRSFTANTPDGQRDFNHGTVLISVQNQQNNTQKKVYNIIQQVAQQSGVSFHNLSSGLTPTGIDLGSPSVKRLVKPEILMVVGDGVRAYEAGEVWHLLDQRYDIPVTKCDTDRFNRLNLERYTTIVLVKGNYSSLDSEKLRNWLKNGGVLITFQETATWASAQGLAGVKTRSNAKVKLEKRRPYLKSNPDNGRNYIGGAIFEMELDLTHPIAYGYHRSKMPTFRKGTTHFEPTRNAYATPSLYTKAPLLSGYSTQENINDIANTGNIIVTGIGRGRTISFADNTNFRGFWWGTNKLFANAIFFGSIIENSTTESATAVPNKKDDAEALEHGHQH